MEGLTSAGTSFVSSSTHRWIYDLQACQTEGSAKRGVGRYSTGPVRRNAQAECGGRYMRGDKRMRFRMDPISAVFAATGGFGSGRCPRLLANAST
jgi:hypothetical protein